MCFFNNTNFYSFQLILKYRGTEGIIIGLSAKDSEFWSKLIMNCAKEAYQEIKGIIGTKKAREKISKGAGGDTTLLIDKLAEDRIMEILRTSGASYKLITEEAGEATILKDENVENEIADTIIVDPIDGSANAAFGLPFSCICIAHANGSMLSDIDCGVMIDIFTGDIYSARKGIGAFKNDNKITGNENTKVSKSLFGLNLSLDEPLADFTKRYNFILNKPLKIRALGSDGLCLGLLASGALDVFLNLRKKTRILDIAAGYIIALEAGCQIWDLEGKTLDAPIALMSRVSFLGFNKGFIKFFSENISALSKVFKEQPSFYD